MTEEEPLQLPVDNFNDTTEQLRGYHGRFGRSGKGGRPSGPKDPLGLNDPGGGGGDVTGETRKTNKSIWTYSKPGSEGKWMYTHQTEKPAEHRKALAHVGAKLAKLGFRSGSAMSASGGKSSKYAHAANPPVTVTTSAGKRKFQIDVTN